MDGLSYQGPAEQIRRGTVLAVWPTPEAFAWSRGIGT